MLHEHDSVANMNSTTVMMVDDNKDEIFLTRRKFRREGFANRFYSQGDPTKIFDALKELEELNVDTSNVIILLDVNMPKENGFETLRKIRAHPKYSDMTVFMFSASDDEVDVLDGVEVGADAYIVKPFTSEEFFAALSNAKGFKKMLLK